MGEQPGTPGDEPGSDETPPRPHAPDHTPDDGRPDDARRDERPTHDRRDPYQPL